MEKMVKIDAYPYEYLMELMYLGEVLKEGDKANVYKFNDKIYKVFDARNSREYIKNQGGDDRFLTKLNIIGNCDIETIARPIEIIKNYDSLTKQEILAFVMKSIGEEYKPLINDVKTTIERYKKLNHGLIELSKMGIVLPDGFNFGNIRLENGELVFIDPDGAQVNSMLTTQSRSDFLDRFLQICNFGVKNMYVDTREREPIYTSDVNTFNSIGLFLYDVLGLDITRYNEDYISILIKDTGIQNSEIIRKIASLYTRDEKIPFVDDDFDDLLSNYEVVDYDQSCSGSIRTFKKK